MSHFLLPRFNEGKDFFLLSTWSLFAFHQAQARDITCDQGRTFLFRDHREKLKTTGLNIQTLWNLVSNRELERIREDSIFQLKSITGCQDPLFVELNGNLHSHILRKSTLKILEQIKISND